MNRRDALKTGFCLLGGACLAVERALAATLEDRPALPRVPANPDLRTRTYELQLAPAWERTVESRLFWLESMLHRLGSDVALALWGEAFRAPDDGLMAAILTEGWQPSDSQVLAPARIDELVEARFASPVEGVSSAQARALVLMDAGVRLPMEKLPSLKVTRQITTYDSLHLRLDGMARLATAMASQLGKEGELLAYDFCRDSRVARAAAAGGNRAADEVLKEWADEEPSTAPTIFSAGLDDVLIRASDTEVILHVTACEWARYFRERHPSVGYLVACSTDDAELRAVTDGLWMQRTSTIMEGGKLCDFRVYKA
jgi:hypothetical protein